MTSPWWEALPELAESIERQVAVVASETNDPQIIARVAVDAYRRWWDESLPEKGPDVIVSGLVRECRSLREELARLKETQ